MCGKVNSTGSICAQKTSKFFVSHGRIHGRTCGCKGSLLKVREEKYKREHGGHRWSLLAERVSFSFLGTFKNFC
jgi:hypothetical protein